MAATYASTIDRCVKAFGYRTMVSDACHNAVRALEHVQYFLSARMDGVVLLASSYVPDTARLVKLQAEHTVPIVSALRDLSRGGITSFVADYRAGAREVTRHLLSAGYCRLAVIVGPEMYDPDGLERLRGAQEACAEWEVTIPPHMIVRDSEGGWNPRVGYRSMQRLLARDPLPEAVVAFDDVTAYGAIRAIYEAGMRVPDNIAVVGFDDLAVSAFYNPALTTVKQPVDKLADAVSEYLVRAIDGSLEGLPVRHTFAPEVVIRASALRRRES
jgi:DNA-binding LacI/PurR family transcriptional regulator